MNVIVVSDYLARGKTFVLGPNHLLLLAATWLAVPLVLATVLYYFMVSHGGAIPFLPAPSVKEGERARIQDDLNAMSARLGQLQAQMMRLDALGGRLVKHFGLPEQDFNFRQVPGQGGAESHLPAKRLSLLELERELDLFAQQLDRRSDGMSVFEALTLREKVKKSAFPSRQPVTTGWFSSNFGWRLDPFTGKQAFHEGVDFMADVGTPIKAAAGGVVVYSDYHSQYGNMMDIDHGNGLTTRYAHASKRLVKTGDIVLPGQVIGEVGSTGRSTGPHLHFEVLSNGAPQNPVRYLQAAG